MPLGKTATGSGVDNWTSDPELRAFTEVSLAESPSIIRKHLAKPYNPTAIRKRDSKAELLRDIAFEEEVVDEDLLSENNEIYQLTDTRGDRESTITPSERHAFQKIFSDIFERHKRSGSDLESSPTDAPEPGVFRHGSAQQAESKLADIFNGTVDYDPMSRDQKEEAVNRYPPALRSAAARAIGLDVDANEVESEEWSDEKDRAQEIEKLEAIREPERKRVEDMMKAAQSDFELWGIMEKEVFSLIPKMGLEELPAVVEQPPPSKTKKSGKKTRASKAKPENGESQQITPIDTTDESGVSALSLYGPLYPSYLLLGLRLLDRSFARPSLLALSLLPKIKSMGFISHVLGASTQFYNELIRIYRYRHDDFTGISNLLLEMENAALEMDEETLEVVFDIVRTQQSVERGDKGSAVKALWRSSNFAPDKLRAWKSKIERAISERESNAGHDKYFT
jgi:hypothetical protein